MTDKDKTKFIYSALERRYKKTNKFTASNIYFFGRNYKETDYLVVNNKYFLYDIEVKVSRGDFKNDFKKVCKHEILESGKYTSGRSLSMVVDGKRVRINKGDKVVATQRPNRFYYAVPKGLLSLSEVPEYAGLLEIDMTTLEVTKTKEAPLLHKMVNKAETNEILVTKFYYRCS